MRWIDHGHGLGMAVAACVLGDLEVQLPDLDGLMKALGRERQRVVETVEALDGVLPDEVVGSVAVVADSHGMVARLAPCVVVALHDVAVGARLGPVGKVGSTFGVNEGVAANTGGNSDRNGEEHAGCEDSALDPERWLLPDDGTPPVLR